MAQLTWLAQRLREDGWIPVQNVSGWQDRKRPGTFNPSGVLLHHTGASASRQNPRPSLGTCINGRPDLAGPLCHVMVDYGGVCHVVAGGRANHAGTAKAVGPMPAGDGNAMYVGIEMDYSGYQSPSPEQYANTVNVAAAILSKLGRGANRCRCHVETSTTGKWDPGSTFAPGEWRKMVQAWLAYRWGTTSSARTSGDDISEPVLSLAELRQEILTNGPRNIDAFLADSPALRKMARS